MINSRDKRILTWIERYDSITLSQCTKIFFIGKVYGYDQARKRLQILFKRGLIKRYRKDPQSEVVYYSTKILKIHDLKIFDVIAEFINNGWELNALEREYHIRVGTHSYILDALTELQKDDMIVHIIIEIDYSHFTGKEKINDLISQFKNNDTHYILMIVKLTQETCITEMHDKMLFAYLPWNIEGYIKC